MTLFVYSEAGAVELTYYYRRNTGNMQNSFLRYVAQFVPLTNTEQQEFLACISLHQFAANELLVTEGEVVQQIYFIEKGSARIYYNFHGREYTGWFAFDYSPVISYVSFLTGMPSKNSVQAMEPCSVWKITKSQLNNLYSKYKNFERFGRLFTEELYIKFVERTYGLQVLNATDRYLELLKVEPDLLKRVPLGFIASYLGISQETFSRIRNKIMHKS